jgi:LytR cell envelope-related transcriptional attenuator
VGRHSSPRQWRYYTSLLRYFLPWILVAVVGVGAVWAGVGSLGDDELQTSPEVTETDAPKRTAKPDPTPTPVESEGQAPEDGGSEEQQDEPAVPLITDGMTVQVLNGTSVTGADDVMADRLASLGYAVVSVAPASISYSQTTVLWSYAESQEAATRLAERFGWQVKPKPDNLSTQVAIHIVVGADESG